MSIVSIRCSSCGRDLFVTEFTKCSDCSQTFCTLHIREDMKGNMYCLNHLPEGVRTHRIGSPFMSFRFWLPGMEWIRTCIPKRPSDREKT